MAENASPGYFEDLRRAYSQGGLVEADIHPDPFDQFHRWMNEAIAAGIREPNAMTLATTGLDGAPDARIVLLKDLSPDGFSFFTNYESAKGRQLAASPRASLVFFWAELERQIRVRGLVTPLTPAQSASYFRTRPRSSQLGAWTSRQSSILPSRAPLLARLAELESEFAGRDVEMPPFWGGYRLAPETFEFWQGRESRLHDRLRYRPEGTAWIVERLSP
jgi:pyridoxamine 5'-phosphate oxidase